MSLIDGEDSVYVGQRRPLVLVLPLREHIMPILSVFVQLKQRARCRPIVVEIHITHAQFLILSMILYIQLHNTVKSQAADGRREASKRRRM